MQPSLSKSQYVKGLQCSKALWFYRNRKDLKPEIDSSTQARFDTGNEIGILAQQFFKQGIEVVTEYWDIKGAEKLTQQYVKDGYEFIYEATAINPLDGAYSRIDILRKVEGTDAWDLIEVKSSTSVKAYHIDDVSLQYHAFSEAGYAIQNCYMMVIDNSYYRSGGIDPQKLFRLEKITAQVLEKQNEVKSSVQELALILGSKVEPEEEIGSRCNKPFECGYKEHCWKDVPKYSIFNIFPGSKADIIAKEIGSYDIADLPEELYPRDNKKIDVASFAQGCEHVDRESLRSFLDQLKYPLYYLDYETIGPAIPLFDGTKAYDQIPFQFSLHVQREQGGQLAHFEYLHKKTEDPRRAVAGALIDLCSNEGSIVVYNQSFEESCNKKMAAALPEYEEGLLQINERMVDLLLPFRNRWLYHPYQESSASIKSVLPAFSGLDYDSMNIADGAEASIQYQSFLEGKLSEAELEQLWVNLSTYCALDTKAMAELIDVLNNKCSER